jgi:hypothetical protein
VKRPGSAADAAVTAMGILDHTAMSERRVTSGPTPDRLFSIMPGARPGMTIIKNRCK